MAKETENKELEGKVVKVACDFLVDNPDYGQFYVAKIQNQSVGDLLTTFGYIIHEA